MRNLMPALLLVLLFLMPCAFGCRERPPRVESPRQVSQEDTEQQGGQPVPEAGETVYEGPRLVSEVPMSRGDLARFSENIGVSVREAVLRLYEVGGKSVRCNYAVPEYDADLVRLFDAIFLASGNQNAVLLGTGGVYEIMADDSDAGEAVRASLADLAPLQNLKFTPYVLRGNASMVSDEILEREELMEIASRVGMELDAVINQLIDLGDRRVQVNFVAPSPQTDPKRLYDKFAELRHSTVGLFLFGAAVVEMPGASEDVAEAVWQMLQPRQAVS